MKETLTRPILTTLMAAVLCILGWTLLAGTPLASGNGLPALQQRQPEDTPIYVDAGWSCTESSPPAFYWGEDGRIFSYSGPFTFYTPVPVVVKVTDAFWAGDQFKLYDNGTAIGQTPFVPPNTNLGECDPDVAYSMPQYSHGAFLLGAGDHSIDIDVFVNPFGSGEAYIRVDTVIFDLSFYDDFGRASLCVDSINGYYQYNILKGSSAGTSLLGMATVSSDSNGLRITGNCPHGGGTCLYCTYWKNWHRAKATLGAISAIIDSNTLNDPPCSEQPS